MNRGPLDNGVGFIQFLWEECKAELEKLDQADLEGIAVIVCRKSDRALPDLTKSVKDGIAQLNAAAKAAKKRGKPSKQAPEPDDPRDDPVNEAPNAAAI